MSENIPESVPTSRDPRSKRPLKRIALNPTSKHASEVEALFANPEQDIVVPAGGSLAKKSSLPPPPEIVANVQGSSAGAGSGEFHVYKASRRREYERLKIMDDENEKEIADAEFERRKLENETKDVSKTEKNRRKREKQKQRKEGKGKNMHNHTNMKPKDPIDNAALHDTGQGISSTATIRDSTHENGEVATSVAENTGLIIHDDT